MFYADTITTPLGPVVGVVDNTDALVQLSLCPAGGNPEDTLMRVQGEPITWDQARLKSVATQLTEYFRGERTAFDLPLALRGTPFQHEVWDELRHIPYGTTLTYKQLAQKLGRPDACRAVGGASGRNPVWIVVPCHRIVGASGALTGYAGGLAAKRYLLTWEEGAGGLFAARP